MAADTDNGRFITVDPLANATFGGRISLAGFSYLNSAVRALESSPALLVQASLRCGWSSRYIHVADERLQQKVANLPTIVSK